MKQHTQAGEHLLWLTNLSDVVIDPTESTSRRISSYLAQIEYPHHFRVGEIPVKLSYAQTNFSLQTILQQMCLLGGLSASSLSEVNELL